MRLVLAVLLAIAASGSADAQALFFNACIASAEPGEEVPFDIGQVCGCAASQAISAGTAPADLDRLMDYVQDDTIDFDSLPESLQVAGASVMESLLGCAMSQGTVGALDEMGPSGEASAEASLAAPGVPSGSAAAPSTATASGTATAPAPIALPAGLRTGNGGGTVRTSTPTPGGAIRVIG